MKNNNYFAIIMAGGIGTRFWPMSRTKKPKQFIDILGSGETLIQQTFNRINRLCPSENIFVVTNKLYKSLVSIQLPDIPHNNILCEPCRRNTAPCICYALHKILLKNKDAVMIVAPSDHIILKEDKFIEVANFALDCATKNDCLITIGITPSRPDTGYGYIQIDNDNHHNLNSYINKVDSFKEKPDLSTAQRFLQKGNYVWNAGIFIWSAKSILNAFKNFLPDINIAFEKGNDVYNTYMEESFIDVTYSSCENISIDYGIMEKADNVFVYKTDVGWSDLGTWVSLFENSTKDDNDNVKNNYTLTVNTNGCIIKAPKEKIVVVDGITNCIIVDEGDILLICDKKREQKIREIVDAVGKKFGSDYV